MSVTEVVPRREQQLLALVAVDVAVQDLGPLHEVGQDDRRDLAVVGDEVALGPLSGQKTFFRLVRMRRSSGEMGDSPKNQFAVCSKPLPIFTVVCEILCSSAILVGEA